MSIATDFYSSCSRQRAMQDNTPTSLALEMGYPAPQHVQDWWEEAEQHKYVLILAARRHFKSRAFAIIRSLHKLLTDPNRQIILAGETATLVEKWLSEAKQQIEKQPGPLNDLKPEKPLKWSNKQIIVDRDITSGDPSIQTVGVGGALLGSGATDIVLDDVVSLENSATLARRDKLENWFNDVIMPIALEAETVTVIGTPWDEDDLYHRMMSSKKWYVIRYPAISDDYPGGVLWPEKYDKDALMEMQDLIGSVSFARQFLLDLTQIEGGVVRGDWIKYYSILPDTELSWRIGVDPSIGKTERSDYTGIVVTAKDVTRSQIRVHDIDVGRWDPQARIDHITAMYRKYPDAHIVIEESAMSRDFIDMITRDTSLPVKPISHGGKDKQARLSAVTPALERGDIIFNRALQGSMLIRQLLEFPDGSYDDLVDAFVYSVQSQYDSDKGQISIANLGNLGKSNIKGRRFNIL